MSELAPQNIRGTIISGNAVMLGFGELLGGLFGLDHIFGIVHFLILVFMCLFCIHHSLFYLCNKQMYKLFWACLTVLVLIYIIKFLLSFLLCIINKK